MIRRRRRGFGQVADVPLSALGLPARRSRELRLLAAWRRVAGAAVAACAPAVSVRRGVLEIRRPDERWLATLEPLLPQLAARLAAAEPSLGIERLRVRAAGERGVPAVELAAPAPDPVAEATPSPVASPVEPDEPTSASGSEALERLRRLYLQRADQRR